MNKPSTKWLITIFAVTTIIIGCKKADSETDIHRYGKNMLGPHTWTGTIHEFGRQILFGKSDTTYPCQYQDYIDVVNDSLLVYHSRPATYFDTMKYVSSEGNQLIFSYNKDYAGDYYVRDTMKYNFVTNVISRTLYSSDNGSGAELSVHTP